MATVCSGCLRKLPQTQRRNVTPGMLRHFQEINRLSGPKYDWVHVSEALPASQKSRMEPKLKYFGLLEHDGVRGSGKWRPTKFGKQFLAGRGSIARALYIKNNTVVDATPEYITVRQIGVR